MADNVASQAVTSAGTTWATDEDTANSRHVPYSKLMFGADGTFTILSASNPLPAAVYYGTTAASTGAGAVGAGVQRMTLASDDPLIAATIVDDAAFTPATTKVIMCGFEFDDTTPDSVNEGDGGAARMSSRREIYTQIRDAAGNERGLNVDANGAIAVSTLTTVTTVSNVATIGTSVTPGTSAAHLGKAVDAAAGASDTGVAGLYVRDDALSSLTPIEGDYVYGRVDANGAIWVQFTPLTTAAGLGKAVDAVAGASDTGVALLAVRDDALSSLTPADGDYTHLRTTSTGALWVDWGQTVYTTDAVAPAAPTGLVSLVQRDDALATLTPADGDWAGPARVDSVGALWVRDRVQLADDAAFTPGTTFVTPMGLQADESAADSVDEGDVGCPRMTLDRYARVVAEIDSTSIRGGTTKRTPTFAVVNASTAGDNTLVAAGGGSLKIRVLQLVLVASGGANTVRLESGASGTALTGTMDLADNGQLVLPFSPVGYCETAANTLLNLELSAATQVAGLIGYITVD